MNNLEKSKQDLIAEIDKRIADKIIEQSNADLLKKLIANAETLTEAIAIAELGTTYKRTGFHFDKRLEKMGNTIKYFKKNDALSFRTSEDGLTHKLIVGDNYDALLNLLVQYRGLVDVIYIDPPYGKDSMGEFAQTNYENSLTRDNLLSMLYPRLVLARQLLSDRGVIFCSIDDRNHAYVKGLFDEIFEEHSFLMNVARLTKKGGKTTNTIANNSDYIIGYTMSSDIIFSQEDKDNLDKYKYEDEFVESRGKYALTQTLDYDSLQYGAGMDYEIIIEGQRYIAGGNEEARQRRLQGNHGIKDWTWRWSKTAVEWGIREKAFVIKNGRIYTKSYLKVRKRNGKNEWEHIDATSKAYTTLSYIDNKYSNDNAKKELDRIFVNGSLLFRNPKPTTLISELIKMVCENENAIILDFFAGSGTTGQAVLELNKDGGKRQFILATLNEVTPTTPNGIVMDVTSKRLKRVMTGSCYDGTTNFKWLENNTPLGDNLDVYDIESVANFEATAGSTPFDVIDETLYGQSPLSVPDKIKWVCENFDGTQKKVESDGEYERRIGGDE